MKPSFWGQNPEAVVRLMQLRKEDPETSPDRKLGLVVEGGGMRGVLSAGVLVALDLMGYRTVFDQVYAASAASVNAAFFLSGQGKWGITIYFDHINNTRFINPLRLNRIVDVDFLFDEVIKSDVVLDERAVYEADADFFVSLTDAAAGQNRLIDASEADAPLLRLLKASSAVPVLYNKTVSVDGREYVDGGVSCKIPIRQAKAAGCTDLLVILTRPSGYVSAVTGIPLRVLFYLMIGRRYPDLMRAFNECPASMAEDRAMAVGIEQRENLNVATICPAASEMIIRRTTSDRDVLLEGSRSLALKTGELFGDEGDSIRDMFDLLAEPHSAERTRRLPATML